MKTEKRIERVVSSVNYAPFMLLGYFMEDPKRLWTLESLIKEVKMHDYTHNIRTIISALSYLLENDLVWFIKDTEFMTANPIERAAFYEAN